MDTAQSEPSLHVDSESAQDVSLPVPGRPSLTTNVSDPPHLQDFQSPARQHKRQPSAHHEVKETLDARVEYAGDNYDSSTYHKINQYTIVEEVGRGSYGAVHLATDQFGNEFAVKEISKSRLRKRAQSQILRRSPQDRPRRQPLRTRSDGKVLTPQLGGEQPGGEQPGEKGDILHLIRKEVAIMKKLHHPNLVQLIEVLDDPQEDLLYMVLELCKKGVAMRVGLDDHANRYSDTVCRYYFRDLILAIEYLHSQSIIHCDIKPDNFLVTEDDTLKVIGFKVLEMFDKPSGMKSKTSAGSPAFLAPELCSPHREVSSTAADVWSMGVCLYCFRYGRIPFNRPSVLDMYHAIQTDDPSIPDDEDLVFADVLRRLLEKDPEKRITIDELREHPWITKNGTEGLLSRAENCAHKIEPPNELEISQAFTSKLDNAFAVLKAIDKFKALLSDRRSTTPTVTAAVEEATFDPAEEKARAEEIEQLLAQRRQVLSERAWPSHDSSNDDGTPDSEGEGHTKDIGDQDPLYLGIGTGSGQAFNVDEETGDVVADSPSAVDYNIYDRAYEQAIKDRLEANPSAPPIMYLTKFVKETDYLKATGNIVENAICSSTAIKEQMSETGEHLYDHFSSPSTTKLAKLVGGIGLSDPSSAGPPAEVDSSRLATMLKAELGKSDGAEKKDSKPAEAKPADRRELPIRMMQDLKNLNIMQDLKNPDSSSETSREEEDDSNEAFYKWQQHMRRRRVSLSGSISKRTFSDRSDSDDFDDGHLDINEINSSARCLRKRKDHESLLFQDPHEPRTNEERELTVALKIGDEEDLTSILEDDFRGIAKGDYAWLMELDELGYTYSEVAAVLLEEASDTPWIFFKPAPQHDPMLVVNFQQHLPGCVHQIPWPSKHADENWQISASGQSNRQSDAISQIQTLCGLAGISPSTREPEDWNGTVVFEDNMVASVTYAHENVSRVLLKVKNILGLFLNALHCAQSAGLCCQSFTILRQETRSLETTQDSVINLSRVEFSKAEAILDEVGSIAKGEVTKVAGVSATLAFLTDIFPGETLFDSENSCFLDDLHRCCLSAQILTVGFLSYIQAHAGPLHPYFLDTPTTKIKLFGFKSLSNQPIIEVALRRLTCLGDMLQSPVLVFGTAESPTKRGKQAVTASEVKDDVLASAEDLIDTWGPAQFIVTPNSNSNKNHNNSSSSNGMQPSAISICGGVIFMAEQVSNRFHWSKQVSPEEFCHGFLDPAVKIRIGSPVTVNKTCQLDTKRCRAHATSLGFLSPLGTYAPAWALAEKQFGIQAGQYAVVQANAAYHRFPGRTLKQYRLEQGDEELVPFLDDCWAVQVSLCTGVARRVPLREMVADLLPIFANNLTFRDDYDNWVCLTKDKGIIEAFRGKSLRPWLRTLSRPHHDLVLQMVRRILHTLSETGLDREGKSLLVSWPYEDDTRHCFNVDLRKRESSWARLIADCEDSAIFVYASRHCLETAEYRCRGIETCPWRNVVPLLETVVIISSAITTVAAGPVQLVPGDRLIHKEMYHFRKLGDVYFVRAEQPDSNAVVKLVRKPSSIPYRFKQRLFSKAQLLRERDTSAEAGNVAWFIAGF
ncbi:calcium/calmodulin-dependent protein kinase kinase [Cordyceps fumosorosea ARSEF 2679]|uniref:Calcium/calmodulin-dependent protein kinase kinase n=1 Tax=Cordyceps fumosorosea (strain ARSEF 2679) TaxID=1081104 RepID=A0A166ZQK8_CORFA|nr:calcium/calmodulin-dependent protein kinase kinase [Cordyceps fumosorosea ARSEF 2679]OAA38153.1 calcium/calmodulin-dependent protein kinase kinase [Cordyceps fumosorosea ARSEF 2679]